MNPDDIKQGVELAQAIPPGTSWLNPAYVVSVLLAAIAAVSGYFLKRKSSENGASDTAYDVTKTTIERQSAEIKEKDARINALMTNVSEFHAARMEADGRASRALVAAELAEAAAKRASEAADSARNECRDMRKAMIRDQAYIAQLRALLLLHNIPIPPEIQL